MTSDTKSIVVERGAIINTLGMGAAPYDSRNGYRYGQSDSSVNVLAVSNGWLDFANGVSSQEAGIELGADCAVAACAAPARLYSDGTIAIGTSNLIVHDALRYGTRNLVLAANSLNVGNEAALADAAARACCRRVATVADPVEPPVDRRSGNGRAGVGARHFLDEELGQFLRFGESEHAESHHRKIQPAATGVQYACHVWTGRGRRCREREHRHAGLERRGGCARGDIVAGGAGTGLGRLDLRARRIMLGDANGTPLTPHLNMKRLALGFSQVTLDATERISANGEGSVGVYQSRGSYSNGAFSYSGGDLVLRTPLLTGEAASVSRITAGGALRLSGAGQAVGAAAIGGSLYLVADSVTLDSAIALPSGKLSVRAERDITLGDGARIDMAGRGTTLFDQTRYSWGGDVELESKSGNIIQSAGSVVDVSAVYNHAGSLRASAMGATAGLIALRGQLLGSASGEYDAGGTYVPFENGRIQLNGQSIEDFSGLNRRLTQTGVTGSRSFQTRIGDLTVGDEVRARHVVIAADGGSLRINGKIDASGGWAASGSRP